MRTPPLAFHTRFAGALALGLAMVASGCATMRGGDDPTAALQGAEVTAREGRDGDVIEEYRVAGQLKVVKVTPLRGPVYYLLDSSKLEGPVSPVYCKLLGW